MKIIEYLISLVLLRGGGNVLEPDDLTSRHFVRERVNHQKRLRLFKLRFSETPFNAACCFQIMNPLSNWREEPVKE